jgi:hypothetical protein
MMTIRLSIANERKGTSYFAAKSANSLPAHPLRL